MSLITISSSESSFATSTSTVVDTRPVNLHPLFLKIGHPDFWKSGTLLFEKNRVQKTKDIVIQKEKRQPGLFSFWIKNDAVFFSLLFGAPFLRIVGADWLGDWENFFFCESFRRKALGLVNDWLIFALINLLNLLCISKTKIKTSCYVKNWCKDLLYRNILRVLRYFITVKSK